MSEQKIAPVLNDADMEELCGWRPSNTTMRAENDRELARNVEQADKGEISDGYHTFNELYAHRVRLFSTLMRLVPESSWWSRAHEDGSVWEGWILAGIDTPAGAATYHLPVSEIEHLPEGTGRHFGKAWDGHTSADVLDRLLSIRALKGTPAAAVADFETVTPEMIQAGANAARDYYERTGGNDPVVIYRAMRSATQPSAQAQPSGNAALDMERALAELVDKIVPGLDTGDLVGDAATASKALDTQPFKNIEELEAAVRFACDVLSEIYAKYQTKIGPFASQAQLANTRLRAAQASDQAQPSTNPGPLAAVEVSGKLSAKQRKEFIRRSSFISVADRDERAAFVDEIADAAIAASKEGASHG